MKISYNQGCTRENSTLALDLVLCEKAGFDVIEPRIDKLHEYLAVHTVLELQTFFNAHRIKPGPVNGIYLHEGYLAADGDPVRDAALTNEVQFAMEMARRLGSNTIIAVPPMNPEDRNLPYGGEWDVLLPGIAATLTRMADMASDFGVNIGLEMVGSPRCSVHSLGRATEVVKLVDRSNIGYTLDSFNLYLNGKMNDFVGIRALDPARIFAVHINGAEREMPVSELRQAHRTFCDRGVLDVDNYLRNLRMTGYDGSVSIEFFRPDWWEKDAAWVIDEAFRTTRLVMERAGVL